MLTKFNYGAILLLVMAYAGTCMGQPHNQSIPVIDHPKYVNEIKSFRAPLWERNTAPENLQQGIENLNVSASGQFSQSTLLKRFEDKAKSDILILDLRMESHGFIDGIPISWYGKKNAINEGLNLKQITQTEQMLLKSLADDGPITVNEIIKKVSGIIYEVEPYEITATSFQTEKELVESLGFHYTRLPVLDRHGPNDETIDAFINLANSLPKDKWLHLHCRGGKGRATTFMVLYDIIKNGDALPLDTIFARQAHFGGKDLRKLPSSPEKLWKRPLAKARLENIQLFYTYRNSKDYQSISWTQWKDQNKAKTTT